MQDNYLHYIANLIKKLSRSRLTAPVLYLIFACFLWSLPQVHASLFPVKLSGLPDMEQMYLQGNGFVSASLENLKFTGYTKQRLGRTAGYFYYTICPDEQECFLVLLSPSTCRQGAPELTQADICGKILPKDAAYDTLLQILAEELSWTDSGIRSKVNTCYLSEPDFRYGLRILLIVLLAAGSLHALVSIVLILFFKK